MERLAGRLDAINTGIGAAVKWAVIVLIVVQFGLVLGHYVFRVGSIMVQESLLYINGFLFLTAAGVTLLEDGHVRVDIFYRGASKRYKARVDFWGTAVFLTPVLALLWVYGLPYVINSWAELEGSIETGGLPAVFLLKTLILFAAATLSLQAVALLLRSWLTLREAA